MKILTALFAAALLPSAGHATLPFAKGDPKAGRILHEQSCTHCHVGMVGGDGSRIYTRANRKVRTAGQLAARVAACNANTGAGWFPEDEAHVGAYLNQQYYKFK